MSKLSAVDRYRQVESSLELKKYQAARYEACRLRRSGRELMSEKESAEMELSDIKSAVRSASRRYKNAACIVREFREKQRKIRPPKGTVLHTAIGTITTKHIPEWGSIRDRVKETYRPYRSTIIPATKAALIAKPKRDDWPGMPFHFRLDLSVTPITKPKYRSHPCCILWIDEGREVGDHGIKVHKVILRTESSRTPHKEFVHGYMAYSNPKSGRRVHSTAKTEEVAVRQVEKKIISQLTRMVN